MVKGVSRRVIVIKTPDPRIFEEAILIVRDDIVRKGVTQAEILKEAQSVAASYVKNSRKKKKCPNLAAPLFALGGAAVMALVWITVQVFSAL